MNDIFVPEPDLEEHHKRLEEVLMRPAAVEIMLNDKCEFADIYEVLR